MAGGGLAGGSATGRPMPKIYRSMKKGDDGKPVVEDSATGLGVRGPSHGSPDVDLDDEGRVVLNAKGMSVAPGWRKLPPHRVSKRLVDQVSRARGASDLYCYCMGGGPFSDGPITDDLELKVDDPKHGVVAPRELVTLDRYQSNLAATRDEWTIDEC